MKWGVTAKICQCQEGSLESDVETRRRRRSVVGRTPGSVEIHPPLWIWEERGSDPWRVSVVTLGDASRPWSPGLASSAEVRYLGCPVGPGAPGQTVRSRLSVRGRREV